MACLLNPRVGIAWYIIRERVTLAADGDALRKGRVILLHIGKKPIAGELCYDRVAIGELTENMLWKVVGRVAPRLREALMGKDRRRSVWKVFNCLAEEMFSCGEDCECLGILIYKRCLGTSRSERFVVADKL